MNKFNSNINQHFKILVFSYMFSILRSMASRSCHYLAIPSHIAQHMSRIAFLGDPKELMLLSMLQVLSWNPLRLIFIWHQIVSSRKKLDLHVWVWLLPFLIVQQSIVLRFWFSRTQWTPIPQLYLGVSPPISCWSIIVLTSR